MITIKLKIPKEECKENMCPMPLGFIPNVVKGISKISHDEKSGIAEITYDEKIINQEETINRIVRFGYKVLGNENDA